MTIGFDFSHGVSYWLFIVSPHGIAMPKGLFLPLWAVAYSFFFFDA